MVRIEVAGAAISQVLEKASLLAQRGPDSEGGFLLLKEICGMGEVLDPKSAMQRFAMRALIPKFAVNLVEPLASRPSFQAWLQAGSRLLLASVSAAVAHTGANAETAELNLTAGIDTQTESFRHILPPLSERIKALEAQQFSTTTVLRGESNMVIGNLFTDGSVVDRSSNSALDEPLRNGISVNYETKLYLDTSFTGDDLLHIRLRSGNFQPSAFWFSEPTPLTRLQLGWETQACTSTDQGKCPSRYGVGINRFYYQFPVSSSLKTTIGARVSQVDILPVFPSVYTDSRILQLFQFAGAQGAYSRRLGAGFGLSWKPKGWLKGLSIGLLSVQSNAEEGDTTEGGLFTKASGESNTAQIAITRPHWNISFAYTYNGSPIRIRGTPLANSLTRDSVDAKVDSYGLSGYWQPSTSGWIPSISAGVGYDAIRFRSYPLPSIEAATTRSWMVGLVWQNVLKPAYSLGFAIGSPASVGSLSSASARKVSDGLFAAELYYRIQLTNHIQIVPAVFWISRPRGAMTATTDAVEAIEQPKVNNAATLSTLGSLVQVTVRF